MNNYEDFKNKLLQPVEDETVKTIPLVPVVIKDGVKFVIAKVWMFSPGSNEDVTKPETILKAEIQADRIMDDILTGLMAEVPFKVVDGDPVSRVTWKQSSLTDLESYREHIKKVHLRILSGEFRKGVLDTRYCLTLSLHLHYQKAKSFLEIKEVFDFLKGELLATPDEVNVGLTAFKCPQSEYESMEQLPIEFVG